MVSSTDSEPRVAEYEIMAHAFVGAMTNRCENGGSGRSAAGSRHPIAQIAATATMISARCFLEKRHESARSHGAALKIGQVGSRPHRRRHEVVRRAAVQQIAGMPHFVCQGILRSTSGNQDE